jgi:hypothetical protein
MSDVSVWSERNETIGQVLEADIRTSTDPGYLVGAERARVRDRSRRLPGVGARSSTASASGESRSSPKAARADGENALSVERSMLS